MGRPKGSKSPASRINGRKGGRPRGQLPPEMRAQLGPAPLTDSLKQSRWYTTALIMLTELQLGGVAGINSLADEVRKNINSAAKMMPHDIVFAAARTVRDDEDEMAADGGPEDEEIEREPSDHGVRCNG